MCPEVASIHFWVLFLSGFIYKKPAYGERSVFENFTEAQLQWPDTADDDEKFEEYIIWLKNVTDTNFYPLHYSHCPVYEILDDIGSGESEHYECIANENEGRYIIKSCGEERLRIETEVRHVTINGDRLDLTKNQIAVVIATFKRYQQGQFESTETRLCGLAENVASNRLRDVFKNHPERLEVLYSETRPTFYKLRI